MHVPDHQDAPVPEDGAARPPPSHSDRPAATSAGTSARLPMVVTRGSGGRAGSRFNQTPRHPAAAAPSASVWSRSPTYVQAPASTPASRQAAAKISALGLAAP